MEEQKEIQEEELDLEQKAEKEKPQEFLGGRITGEEIAGRKDNNVKIVGYGFEDMKSLDDDSKTITKLCLKIELVEGAVVEWLPNKTSQDVLRARFGTRALAAWVGEKFELTTKLENVRGAKIHVIYVKEE